MITADYIREQLSKVQSGEPSPAKVRDYALLCVALEHISGTAEPVIAESAPLPSRRDSEFLQTVSGRNPEAVWAILDQYMSGLRSANEKAYHSIIKRLKAV